MKRAAVIVGAVGVLIGAGFCVLGLTFYWSLPPFQRGSEPLSFIVDFFLLFIYAPAALMLVLGVIIVGASVRLIVKATQDRRPLSPATLPAWRPIRRSPPGDEPSAVAVAAPRPPPVAVRRDLPPLPPIAFPREIHVPTVSAMIVLAAMAVVCSVAIILFGVWALSPWREAFSFRSRPTGFMCIVFGGYCLVRSAKQFRTALGDWDRLTPTARGVTATLLAVVAALLVVTGFLFVAML